MNVAVACRQVVVDTWLMNEACMQVMYVQPAVVGAEAVPVIENISVSNGDHVVNGIDFLHDGRLLVAVGSQTNAGIEGALGLLPVCLPAPC